MSFKARRLAGTVLIVCLFIQMQIAANGYAARGTKIAFTSTRDGNYEIYVMDGDGRNQRRVTVNPAVDFLPAWSPDSKKIAFVSNRTNRNKRITQIWVIDAVGKNPIRLTDGLGDSYPVWSPDGTKIAYQAFRKKELDIPLREMHYEIFVMDADGNRQRRLTDEGGEHPSWSPDGKRIAYAHGQIFVMDADGQNQMQLTHDLVHTRFPSWSPDGQWIAFDSRRDGVYHIYVVKTDGSDRASRLTRRRQDHSHPAWSPDGDTIAYAIREPGGFWTINLMDQNGRHLKQLTKAHFNSADPDWFDPTAWSVSPAASFVTIWGEIKKPTSARR